MGLLSTITAGGALTTLAGWLARLGWKVVQRDRETLHAIHKELQLQRVNCLATIQANTARQVDLLEELNGNINEQNGFVRGLLEGRHNK